MEGSRSVYIWWGIMSLIAVINFMLLAYTYKLYNKRKPQYTPLLKKIRGWHMVLAVIYVFVCAFRSFLPRLDVDRLVMVDHWISAVAIGRSLATIAELSFGLQWSLILYEIGRSTNNKTIIALSKPIVPLLVIAEVFSWYACLTSNYIGSTIEESLWGISAAIFVVGLLLARPMYQQIQKTALTIMAVLGSGYVVYMAAVDVPSYIRKFLANQATGKEYATVMEGFVEVATVWRYTRAYEDWQYAMVWMTLYFSLAVWASMWIVNLPRWDKGLKKH